MDIKILKKLKRQMIDDFIRNSIESCQIIFIIKYDALKWHFNEKKMEYYSSDHETV